MLWTSWDERTDRRKTVYPSFRWSGGIVKLLWHMIMHGSVIRTKFQVCKLQLKHMKLTWQVEARFKIFIVRIITNITALFSNIYWETARIKNKCLLGNDHLTWRVLFMVFSKKIFWFPMLLKKIFWFWCRKKKIIWFRVFVI